MRVCACFRFFFKVGSVLSKVIKIMAWVVFWWNLGLWLDEERLCVVEEKKRKKEEERRGASRLSVSLPFASSSSTRGLVFSSALPRWWPRWRPGGSPRSSASSCPSPSRPRTWPASLSWPPSSCCLRSCARPTKSSPPSSR